jgi:hypothetical protein
VTRSPQLQIEVAMSAPLWNETLDLLALADRFAARRGRHRRGCAIQAAPSALPDDL